MEEDFDVDGRKGSKAVVPELNGSVRGELFTNFKWGLKIHGLLLRTHSMDFF